MARKQVCRECGYWNYARAWECAGCGQMSRYAKVQMISFAATLTMLVCAYFYMSSLVSSVLPS